MMKSTRIHEAEINAARQAAMATIASSPGEAVIRLWRDAGLECNAQVVRGPETGLVTVRGCMGGGGGAFNCGEATVTRATVRLDSGEVGHAYALGRDREKVRVAAIIDAQWQSSQTRTQVEEALLAPLRKDLDAERQRRREETEATKVDFFTLVRGED